MPQLALSRINLRQSARLKSAAIDIADAVFEERKDPIRYRGCEPAKGRGNTTVIISPYGLIGAIVSCRVV
jgi:hypothetical protein